MCENWKLCKSSQLVKHWWKNWWHQRQTAIIFSLFEIMFAKTVAHKNRKKRETKSPLHLSQWTGYKSCSNTKHYVCAFVTWGAVIPRATNRKYPSERMKLGAVSRGCCGWICWCRLAYLSQKAASAVQKRGGWCHESATRVVMNRSTAEHHKVSLYLSALSYPYLFFPL